MTSEGGKGARKAFNELNRVLYRGEWTEPEGCGKDIGGRKASLCVFLRPGIILCLNTQRRRSAPWDKADLEGVQCDRANEIRRKKYMNNPSSG